MIIKNFTKKIFLKFRKLYRIYLGQYISQLFLQIKYIPPVSKDFTSLFQVSHEDHDEAIIKTADQIIQGNYQFLGINIKSESIPDWHKDYISGFRWPLVPSTKIYNITPGGVDLKNPWELSSFFHLLPVALAYQQIGDKKYKEFTMHQISNWIQENPVNKGVNWSCPMSVAIRLILMIEISRLILLPEKDKTLIKKTNGSIWQHLFFLIHNLENLDVSPANHYLSNLTGILWGSLYFYKKNLYLKYIQKWAIKQLTKEVLRQTNPDGFNFECSTNYHRLVTEFVLYGAILMQNNHTTISEKYLKRLNQMLVALDIFVMPDANLPVIGDADDCRLFYASDYFSWNKQNPGYLLYLGGLLFNNNHWITKYKSYDTLSNFIQIVQEDKIQTNRELLDKSQSLPESGFYVSKKEKDVLLINSCHPGHFYGSHSHNDTFSFSLVFNGVNIFIDPGCYVYTRDIEKRNHFRSTQSHNVLQLENEEQWPFTNNPFVLYKHQPPQILSWNNSEEQDFFEAKHFGYLRAPFYAVHQRAFLYKKAEDLIIIKDSIKTDRHNQKGKTHRIKTHFILSEQVQAHHIDKKEIDLKIKGENKIIARMKILSSQKITTQLNETEISKQYGLKGKSTKLTLIINSILPFEQIIQIQKITS